MTIELEAITHHAHYPDPRTGVRVMRCPGDRYVVDDAPGLTASQYARAVIAMGIAKRVDPKPQKSKASR